MTPDQLEKKIQHYTVLLAQTTDSNVTLTVRLEDALAEVERLQAEVDAANGKAAEVPAADEDAPQEG